MKFADDFSFNIYFGKIKKDKFQKINPEFFDRTFHNLVSEKFQKMLLGIGRMV